MCLFPPSQGLPPRQLKNHQGPHGILNRCRRHNPLISHLMPSEIEDASRDQKEPWTRDQQSLSWREESESANSWYDWRMWRAWLFLQGVALNRPSVILKLQLDSKRRCHCWWNQNSQSDWHLVQHWGYSLQQRTMDRPWVVHTWKIQP